MYPKMKLFAVKFRCAFWRFSVLQGW